MIDADTWETQSAPIYLNSMRPSTSDPVARDAIREIMVLIREETMLGSVVVATRVDAVWRIVYQLDDDGYHEGMYPAGTALAAVLDQVQHASSPLVIEKARIGDPLGDSSEAIHEHTFLGLSAVLTADGDAWVVCASDPSDVRLTDSQLSRFRAYTSLITKGLWGDSLLRLHDDHFQALMEHLRESITIVSPEGTVVYESPAARQMLGYGPDQIEAYKTAQLLGLIHPDDVSTIVQISELLIQHPDRPQHSEYRVRHADGSWRWLSAYATNLIGEPAVRGTVHSTVDITERKNYDERLHFESRHDFLTGLYNRFAFERELDAALGENSHFAVLYIDLDNFHTVNTVYGHAAGDDVLRDVARRFQHICTDDEVVARFGGDEFMVLTPVTGKAQAEARASQYLACFATPCVSGPRMIAIRGSAGVAIAPLHGRSLEHLYRAADRALYRVKAKSAARIAVFDEELDAGRAYMHILGRDFSAAAEQGDVFLHFQPIRNLDDGSVAAAEGLVRWAHPTLGLLTPVDFFPVIDEHGFGDQFARLTIRQACQFASRRQIPVAINFSANQLHYSELVTDVSQGLEEYGVAPDQMIIEITEYGAVAGVGEAMSALKALHKLGVRIAIDDFGTGYSDLAALRSYPVDILKIDRGFVSQLDNATEDRAIVRAIMALAAELGLAVIAEGIETLAQAGILRNLGCKMGQGFALGRPVPSESFPEGAANYVKTW